jgi:PIN domain nuclease of toxin-antitoxin system
VNYLLDTHAFIWWITGNDQFPKALQKKLGLAAGTIYISVVSLWEMALKIKLGKLQMPEPFDQYVLHQIQINRMEVLPVHAPHIFETLRLPPHHRDPFDRLLVAQARVETLTLVSRDAALKPYPIKLMW